MRTWPETAALWLRAINVTVFFIIAFFLGALKALLVGPVAALLMIIGNSAVILGLFPFHAFWTVYTIFMTNHINAALKFAILLFLPILFGLWLGLSLVGNFLVGAGYGIFTPWVSTFEAFREDTARDIFYHSIVDGTWGTVKGSCTAVRDFADVCYHSYPLYLKEFRKKKHNHQPHSIRLIDVPKGILVGLIGLIVEIPLYTIIALIKSPLLLFKGWQRMLHDLISREGIFIETVCVPIAGLAILFWPLVVIGSFVLAVVSSIFVGLYGAVIVYQEASFRSGIAFIIAMVAEFDEYTNDWLYLREGTLLPKPNYLKRRATTDLLAKAHNIKGPSSDAESSDVGATRGPRLTPSRSVREVIQEVKMVQIWAEIVSSWEKAGKELLGRQIVTMEDLNGYLNSKGISQEMVGIGIPSYSFLHGLLFAIDSGSGGLMLTNGIEVTHMNRPQDMLLDWFFQPIIVLKDQIKVLNLKEEEVRFLEKLVLFNDDTSHMDSWYNGSVTPHDPTRAAQIKAISRRLVGMTRIVVKFPTYRRKYRQVVKNLVAYSEGKATSAKPCPTRSVSSADIVAAEV